MQPQSSLNRAITLRNGLLLLVWAGTLLASLSIARLPGDWGHSICGAWGCGPPLQALVGCHLSWLVLLLPIAVVASRPSQKAPLLIRQLGKSIFAAGVLMLLAVLIYQGVTWLPTAGEWQRSFFWQRYGFVIATTVEVPMLQLVVIGLFMMAQGQKLLSLPPGRIALAPTRSELEL